MATRRSWGVGRITTWSLAFALLTSCGSSRPKPQSVPNADQTPKGAGLNPLPIVMAKVEKAQPALLQKSVARVLGYVEVEGRLLDVYRDAYSALYGALAVKNGLPPENTPPTLIYVQPSFAADKPEAILTEAGVFRITIPNRHSAQALKGQIWEKMKAIIEPLGATKERINVVPFHQVSATIRAYNRDYIPEVAPDLSRIVVEVPKANIPPAMKSPDGKSLLEDGTGGFAFVSGFTSIVLKYSYYVQKVQENACRFSFDAEYFQSMYIDSKCPATIEKPTADALQTLEAANPSWKGMKDIIDRASVPITACLAGKEQERLAQRASVSCTKSLQSSDGSRKDVSEALSRFAKQTNEMFLSNAQIGEMAEWSKEAAAAAVLLFGSPEKYAQAIEKFSTDVLNKSSKTFDESTFTANLDFIEKIDEFSSKKESESKKNGGGGFLFLVAFGSNESSSNSKSLEDIFKAASLVDKSERAASLNRMLQENGYNHEVTEFGGKIRFYPKVNFSMRTDVDKIRRASQELSTTELGDIVTENSSFTGELKLFRAALMRGYVVCNGARVPFVKELDLFNWWREDSYRTVLSTELSRKLAGRSCATVGLEVWFDAPPNSSFVPPSPEPWSVDILVPPTAAPLAPAGAPAGTPAPPPEPVRGQQEAILRFNPRATEAEPSRMEPVLGVAGKSAIGIIFPP